MVPSLFHAPPPGDASAWQMVSGAPPVIFTFCKLRAEKNAMYWLSGDQNGADAPSVPGITVACSASSGRSHSIRLPSGPTAEKVRYRPSGDTAGIPG